MIPDGSRTLQPRSGDERRLGRDFHLLWGATALSNLGDGLRLTALPLLATTVTDDARLIAGVVVAERIPWLLFILPGGAWADRVDRRRLRMRLDVARAVVMAVLVLAIVADRAGIVVIYLITALLASGEAVVDSSSMALVPSTVRHLHQLERAAGRLESTELAMNGLLGPPLGGLLFAVALAAPFAVDALSFLGAALVVTAMSGSYVPSAGDTSSASLRGQIGEGFRWLWANHTLRRLAVISTALGTASFVGAAVFVIFARDELGLSPGGYGLLLVPGAVGGIAGSLLAARLTRFPLGRVLGLAILVDGLAMWAIAGSSQPVVVGVLFGLNAATVLVWNVLTVALRQRIIPDHLLGRVGASYRFLVYLGMPVGALAGGFLADSFGVRTALAIQGISLVAIAVTIPFALRGAHRR